MVVDVVDIYNKFIWFNSLSDLSYLYVSVYSN